MKKLFYSFFAAAAMLFAATSCSQEEMIENGTSGDEVEVSFNVEMEGQVASRTIADGLTVDQLIFAVYDKEGVEIQTLRQDDVKVSNKGAVVETRLVKGQEYQFVFWAQKSGQSHYTLNTDGELVVNYTDSPANDETRDAFYHHEPTFKVSGSFSKNVTLKRPFAQLNLGTTAEDIAAAAKAGVNIAKSSVKVTRAAYGKMNVLTGAVEDEDLVEVAYTLAAIPNADEEELEIKDTEDQFKIDNYEYLASDYFLANTTSVLSSIEYTLVDDKDNVINKLTIENAPLQRNWRTNIVGEILTGEGTFNIVIDPIFEADRNYPMDGSELDIWDGKTSTELTKNDAGEYIIDQASDLSYIWQQDASKWNNATFRLTKDLSFKNVETRAGDTTPATIEPLFGEGNGATNVTFYGDDHVIRDFIIDGQNKLNSLFGGMVGGSIQNLTIINAEVKGMNDENGRAAIAVAQTFGTVKFENITIKNSYLEGAQKVGGLIGFVHENQVEVTNCIVDGLELKGIDNAEAGSNGGLIGCINKGGENKITNSYVKNSTFNLIQQSNEDVAKRANGQFIGLIRGTSTIVNITNCGVADNDYTNSIAWEPFHPEFVGGNYNEEATLIVNGSVYPEVLPDYIDKGEYLEVYTAKGLLKWGYRVNKGEKNLGLQLMHEIVMPEFEIAEDAANETYAITTTPITVTDGVPSGSNWVPVCGGISVLSDSYSGHINGNNIVIRGLRVVADNDQVGFIGAMYDDASIKNLTIEDAVIKGKSETGAVVGRSQHGTVVENVHVKSSIIKGTSDVGGIAGRNYRRVGGASGQNYNEKISIIQGCTTDKDTEVISTGSNVGGICGQNYGAAVVYSFNSANVSGNSKVGGIVGYSRDYHHNVNSYVIACGCTSEAIITATSSIVGGIVGQNFQDISHENSVAYVVGCYSNAQSINGSTKGLIVGQKVYNGQIYGSWAHKNQSIDLCPSTDAEYIKGSFALESMENADEEKINLMNQAITEYNSQSGIDLKCLYKWSWTAGSWPVLVQK